METYLEFLKSKIVLAKESGFDVDPGEINPNLKPHQRDSVIWALRGGHRALFQSFGLGKTVQEIEFCHQAVKHDGGRALYEASRTALLHNVPKRETKIYFRKFSKEGQYASEKSAFCCKKYDFLLDAPFESSHMCCRVMKKKPVYSYEKSTGRKPFIGMMAAEGIMRMNRWMQVGCNAFEAKRPTSHPLSFWTEQDILQYIKKFNVPYCPVYGEIKIDDNPGIEGQMNWIDYLGCYEPQDRLTTTGCNRTGCMFCMFGCHLEKEPNRFQRMKVTHPKQYAYCMDKLGLRDVLEYIGVPYE